MDQLRNTGKLFVDKLEKSILVTGAIAAVITLMAAGLYALQTSTGFSISNLFSLDSARSWWYISRAAGLMGYILFWLSTVWGFAISSKILDSFLERTFTYDFHEHLSLLGIGFVALHIIVLLLDTYAPFSIAQLMIPFTSTYRPFWVGIGIISLYITILVTASFYLRKWISMQMFRKIHVLSVVAYLGVLLHGVYSGTDSTITWVQLMYLGTSLFTIFFFTQWMFTLYFKKRELAVAK
jgi:sulfoxide reductase heme-binding subunit YedZ